jgi:hypothetical protein
VLNLSILVPAKTELTIPVSCVERGRWSYARQADFTASPQTMFARARAGKSDQVSRSLRESATRAADQSAVWRAIEEKMAMLRTPSATRAMSHSYEHARPILDDMAEAFPLAHNQRGAVFAIDGRIIGLELFDRASTYSMLVSKIVRSYGLDAVETTGANAAAATLEEASRFLWKLASSTVERYDALGLGSDWRLRSDELTGGALVTEDTCVHLAAFIQPKDGRAYDDVGRASEVRRRRDGGRTHVA